MKRNFYYILFLFAFNLYSYGQTDNIGIPLINNYTEEDTNSNLTVFGSSQGEKGELYFATLGGLLEFDGIRWENYSSKKDSDLRDVLYIDDNHIYTSGHGAFGFWSKNEKGKLEYTSLFRKEPEKQSPLLPVFWKIKESNGKILFQTFQQIFIYDPQTNNLDFIVAQKGYNLLFSSNGRNFIQDTGLGLFEIKGKNQVLLTGTDKVDINVIGIRVINDNELLIFTKNDGIWNWKSDILTKINCEANAIFEKYLINDVKEFDEDRIIVGTRRNGLYVISNEGEVLQHVDKGHGILANSINSVFLDNNNNIWLGFQDGISYLQISGSNSYLIDVKGVFGTVYASYLEGSTLYLGTNQGLFYKDLSNPNSEPKLIDKDLEQIWEISKVDGQLLVGSHKGVYLIEDKKIKTVHIEGGAWRFIKHPKKDNILYIGFYSGISVFVKEKGLWKFKKTLDGYGESSRFIEFDKRGQMWVAHPSKGYYRLRLTESGIDLKEVEFYGEKTKNVYTFAYLCSIDDELVFYNPTGYFNYDPIDNTFIPAKYASEIFKEELGLNSICQIGDVFWYSSPTSLGYIIRDGNKFENIREDFYSIRKNHLQDFNKYSLLKDSLFGVGIKNGMVFHKIEKSKQKKADPILKYVNLISTSDTINSPTRQKGKLEIPYRNNYLKIGIGLPNTPIGNSRQIQYKLNGIDKGWSKWDYISELKFPGLSPGDYVLEIRVRGENDQNHETIKKEFFVKYPWYLSKKAFLVYFLIFILINILYSYYFRRKNKRRIKAVKDAEEEKRIRQSEQFEFERLESEREMLLLKEENLQLEINRTNSELAYSTLNNVKKNELLHDIKREIKEIDKNVLNNSLHSPINKVIKKINDHLVDKEDWLAFELHFRNAHAQFFDNLREKHPSLSSNDIKLSAYLKLNLSSKEIASLMNIAVSSVEQSRYRLRKKLELDPEVGLVNYIQTF